MPLARDRCICLRKVEYSETSQILSLFGRDHGLLQVIAKGAHRRTKAGASKFDGGADLLDVGEAVFTFDPAREMHTLTEWSLREGNLPLHNRLRSMHLGLYSAELTLAFMVEHDAQPELFNRLENTLRELGTRRAEEAFLAYQIDLLRQSGHLANLDFCAECGAVSTVAPVSHFSASLAGVICRNCQPKVNDTLPLDPRLLALTRQLLKLPRSNGQALRLPMLTRHQTDPLNRIFARLSAHILGRRLRMPAYVLSSGD